MDSDLKDLEHYVTIGVAPMTTENKTNKAFRKKAIHQCHPNENSDNLEAAELLPQLSELSILLENIGARLDNLMLLILNAKIMLTTAQKLGEKERDSKKKTHKEKKQPKHLKKEYLFLHPIVRTRINVMLMQHRNE